MTETYRCFIEITWFLSTLLSNKYAFVPENSPYVFLLEFVWELVRLQGHNEEKNLCMEKKVFII